MTEGQGERRNTDLLKRLLASWLGIMLIFSSIPALVWADLEQVVYLENDYIGVSINKNNGRFSIQTKAGHPSRDQDSNKPLLFEHEVPDTSFTTFRINGKDYIYGNDYGFLGSNGTFTYRPTSQGLVNQSKWRVEGLEIVQTLALVTDRDNPNLGNVRISYEVKNVSHAPVQIGSRILLDTMLGAQDASPVIFPGYEHFVETETEISGSIPAYWRAVDDPIAPKVISYGFLHGWGNDSPDRLVVAHWEGISRTKWDYDMDEYLNFTSKLNAYRSADSAFALYWDPADLQPGEEKVFETYYGLGSFVTSFKSAKYDTQLIAPKQLTVNEAKEGYVEEEFAIQLVIDNTTSQAETMTNVVVEIGLPDELELVDEDQYVEVIPSLAAGETREVIWQVKAKPQSRFTAARYWVSVNADEVEEVLQSSFIVLPALSGALPEVHILDVLPDKLHAESEEPFVYVKGSGFEALQGNWDARLELVRERDGHRYDLKDINISDDKEMVIHLGSIWGSGRPEAGRYTLHIDAGEYGSFSKVIEVTEDPKYLSRSYGILAIIGEGRNYEILPLASEDELRRLRGGIERRVLVEIRGDIQEIHTDKTTLYRVKPGATINSVISFSESSNVDDLFGSEQVMLIEKKKKDDKYENDYVEISGAGVLAVPAFPFLTGNYSIVLENGKYYSLTPKDDQQPVEISLVTYDWLQSVQRMSFFPVKIKNAMIGDKTIAFGGTIGLNFKPREGEAIDDVKKKRSISPQLGIDIDKALFGIGESGQFEFQGIRSESVIGMPKDLIQGVTFGAQARALIDTFDHIYEIEVDVAFQLIEFYGLLTIKFTESNIPVIDNLAFVVGGEPGLPLVPPKIVAFITQAGGGFRNLHATVTGDFEVLPPLSLFVVGSLDIGTGKNVSLAEMKLEASLRGISFEGALDVMKIRLIERGYGSIEFADSRSKLDVTAKIGGEIDLYDVLVGNVQISFSYNSSQKNHLFGPISMGGGGNVKLKVPDFIPFVGGTEIAGVRAGISTESVYAGVTYWDIPIGVQYFWGDGGVVIPASSDTPNVGLYSETSYSDYRESYSTLMYGSNFHRVSSSRDRVNDGFVLFSTDPLEHSIVVGAQNYALFEFEYTDEVPEITILDPDNEPYVLIEDENYRVQEIPAEISLSGMDEKRIYVKIIDPKPGTWTVKSDQPISYTLYDVEEIARLTDLQATELGNNTYETEWEVSSGKGEETVALYLTEDHTEDSGRLIEDGIPAKDGKASFTLPDSLQSGQYYVKAILMDGETPVDHRYSETSIAYVNHLEPDAPVQVEATPAGNGLFHLAWEDPSTPDGYMIEVLDEAGNPIEHTGVIEVEGEKREAVIGGMYEGEDGELFGLVPGESYHISVMAYNVADGAYVYSEPVVSDLVWLPEPTPAHIDLEVSLDEGILRKGKDEDGKTVYYANKNMVNLAITTDQTAEIVLQLNDAIEESLDVGQYWNEGVELEEGRNLVRLLALNEHGDYSETAVEIVVDTTPPDLKIESPANVHVTVDGKVLVKGTAEPGSIVTINGDKVILGESGQFEKELSMEGFLSRTVLIVAEDRAGNQSQYEAVVANQRIDAIQNVKIRPLMSETEHETHILMSKDMSLYAKSEEPEDTYSMAVGQRQAFELIGVDAEGHEIKINPNQVTWNFLLGEEYGSLSENGVLRANHAGEMVITASYALTDDYALENTLIIEASGEYTGDPDDPPGDDPDEWYVPPPPRSPESPGSGSDHSSSGPDVDSILRAMIRNLMQQENDVEFIDSFRLHTDEDTVIQIGDDFVLRIRPQDWQETIGVGVGRVRNQPRYQLGSLQFLTEIFEIRTNLPVQFDEPPLLTLRIDLGDMPGDTDGQDKIGIYWFNEQEERWEYIGSTLDPANGTISAKLPHFSKYAVIYDEARRIFADMANRWSEQTIYRLASVGIVDGIAKDGVYVYEPTRSITRQEFAKLLAAVSNVSLDDAELPTEPFADVAKVSGWAKSYMAVAVERGWISGTLENGQLTLQPLRPISRAEAAVMVARMLDGVLKPKDSSSGANGPAFNDQVRIPSWAADSIASLQASGIISGYPDGTFRPDSPISREEGAEIIKNVIDYLYHQGRRIE